MSDSKSVNIRELWDSKEKSLWERALHKYWNYVKDENRLLEEELENLGTGRIATMNEREWFTFLHDEYFKWKYTAKNRYASTTKSLKIYEATNALPQLNSIRKELLALKHENIGLALSTATQIRGLGTAGASGLLSLMYPQWYGTVDQFAVKALRLVQELTEAPLLAKMKDQSLTIQDGVTLITIMREKATELNQSFNNNEWTPRKIDMILWVCRSE